MNEIVKYNNDLNKLNFAGFSKSHSDLFMAICSKMKGVGTDSVTIEFDELRNIASFRDGTNHDLFNNLEEMSERLLRLNCKIIERYPNGKRKVHIFDLFPTFTIDEEKQTLTVGIHSDWSWLLNEFIGYTTFELAEFVSLKSKYSKNLYRILKQWRTTGSYVFNDPAEFRLKLDIPKSYTNRDITEKVIKPIAKEISDIDGSFKELQCEVLKARKRGSPVIGYKFTWQAESTACVPKNGIKNKAKGKPTKFSNFTQRDYDFGELERKLLK